MWWNVATILIGLLSIIITTIIAISTIRFNQRLAERAAQDAIQPILAGIRIPATLEPSSDTPARTIWGIKNIGRGPAMNVVAGIADKAGHWAVVDCNPIALGEIMPLEWSPSAWEIGVEYTNAIGTPQYVSTTAHNKNHFATGRSYSERWKDIYRRPENEVQDPTIRRI